MCIKKFLIPSLIGLSVSHQAYATDDIIHDAEYVRMEQQFGKQWRVDDVLVKKSWPHWRQNSVRNPILSISWQMTSGIPNLVAMAEGRFAVPQHRTWIKWLSKASVSCPSIPRWNVLPHAVL